MDFFRIFFLIIVLGFSSIPQAFANDGCFEDPKSCSLAIFPHSNFKQLLITYKSLLEDLSLVLDARVKLVSARTMSDFAHKLDKKAYDIALIGSGQYLSHGVSAGYIPLVRRDKTLDMRLFSRADSGIHSYQDLRGRKLGFMVLNTTTWYSASILLQKYNVSKDDIDLISLGSQQACAHAMAIKKVDACVFSVSNLEIIQQQNVNINVRGIGEILKINNPVYAVHSDMPQEMVDDIKSYLLSRDGYVEAHDDDFSAFRHYIAQLK